jgi:hypothetical protein
VDFSTKDLLSLPTIDTLKKLTQSLAMLDAIMRDWEYGYYSFNGNWAENEQMASMRNGQGDGWYFGLGLPGAFLKGFDHESEMSPWNMEIPKVWPGVLEAVPEVFKSFATTVQHIYEHAPLTLYVFTLLTESPLI